MFVSPVIYPLSFVPAKWRWVMWLNPLVGIIEGFRAVLFGKPVEWELLGVATALTLILLIFAAFIFRRMEKSFADVV